MEKLNTLGIGPKIARVTIPFLLIAILLTIFLPGIFTFGPGAKTPLMIIGFVILGLGVVCWAITVRYLLKGLRSTQLMTTGPFALCLNPLYASIMLLVVPGVALAMNSWIILLTPLVAYTQFRAHIRQEYAEMEKFFGDVWREYAARTPEIFPFTKGK